MRCPTRGRSQRFSGLRSSSQAISSAFALRSWGEIATNGVCQPRFVDVVHTVGRLRVEAAEVLETAARAGLEARDPFAQAQIDGGVVADVEVQMSQLLERPPVASVQDGTPCGR